MNLQKAVTIYIDCLESPANGLGQHYLVMPNGSDVRSDHFLAGLYHSFGRDKTNAELDRQFNERRRRSNER